MNLNPYNLIKSAIVGGLLLANPAGKRTSEESKYSKRKYSKSEITDDVLKKALIANYTSAEWSNSYTNTENAKSFLYSFEGLNLKALGPGITDKFSDKLQNIADSAIQKISSYSNVKFKKVGDWRDTPENARKISISW
jgi:hypothetical protein